MKNTERSLHPDDKWIAEKIGKSSGSYGWEYPGGPAKIDYIYKVPRIKIFWYNIQLYYKYLKRRKK